MRRYVQCMIAGVFFAAGAGGAQGTGTTPPAPEVNLIEQDTGDLAEMADMSPEEMIHIRQENMKMLGDAARTLTRMARGQDPYNAESAVSAFDQISQIAATFPDLFPEGTNAGNTKAAPAVWENMEDFLAKAGTLEDIGLQGTETAQQGQEAVAALVQDLGAACSDCHQSYRLK